MLNPSLSMTAAPDFQSGSQPANAQPWRIDADVLRASLPQSLQAWTLELVDETGSTTPT